MLDTHMGPPSSHENGCWPANYLSIFGSELGIKHLISGSHPAIDSNDCPTQYNLINFRAFVALFLSMVHGMALCILFQVIIFAYLFAICKRKLFSFTQLNSLLQYATGETSCWTNIIDVICNALATLCKLYFGLNSCAKISKQQEQQLQRKL